MILAVPHADRALPVCAVCEREVEHVASQHDLLTNRYVYLVECHGQIERVELSIADLRNVTGLAFGRAFVAPPALPPGSR